MKQKEDNRNKWKIAISLFIAFIMVASILGFMMEYYTSQRLNLGKYRFTRTDQGFSTVIDKKEVLFEFFPTEVNITDFDKAIIDRLKPARMFYITYDINASNYENMGRASYETSITLSKFDVFVQPAFTNLSRFAVPVITCENATQFVPVVYFRDSNQTRAYLQANCIIFEADSELDFLRLKDRMLYGFFGILP